jgi:hypothetical protein
MVYTPMMYASKAMSNQEREARKERSLLKTEGNGWDVGSAVRFLASDLSRWMTGKKTNHPFHISSRNLSHWQYGILIFIQQASFYPWMLAQPRPVE